MNRNVLRNLAMALLVSVTLAGCVKEYTITVVSNNDAWGTVTGTGTYAFGEEVTITATPATGYYFQRWDDGVNTNPRIVTVEGTKVYTAVFASNSGDNPPSGGEPVRLPRTISENTTLQDLGLPIDYIVGDVTYIDGTALLTVEPGVTIMFENKNAWMRVDNDAGINMVGTAEKPIVFTGPTNNQNKGSWNCLEIHSTRNENRLEYVHFINGGSSEGSHMNGVLKSAGKIHMNNCLIDGSLGNGLFVDGSGFYSFTNNTVKNCDFYPIWLRNTGGFYTLEATGNTFTANGKNMIYLWKSDDYFTIEENTTLKRMPIPYVISVNMRISGAFTYTIEPGTELLFEGGKVMTISEETTFNANGTAEQPIVIRGLQDEAGYWYGINYSSRKAASIMNYCNISGGGYPDFTNPMEAPLYIQQHAVLTLTNCTISKSQYYGIYVWDRYNYSITHSNNTFLQCAAGNVFLNDRNDDNNDQILPDLP